MICGEGYKSKSSSFKARGTDTLPEVVPFRKGDTGGLAWGVVGAVRLPEVPTDAISTRELERDGGAEPGIEGNM